eukprot:COSAG03_NODE_139_length_11780_cov_2.736153_9_plen_79_part_00
MEDPAASEPRVAKWGAYRWAWPFLANNSPTREPTCAKVSHVQVAAIPTGCDTCPTSAAPAGVGGPWPGGEDPEVGRLS